RQKKSGLVPTFDTIVLSSPRLCDLSILDDCCASSRSQRLPLQATLMNWFWRLDFGFASRLGLVLVVAFPPDAGFVAPLGSAIEPLVHPPATVQSARIRGIGVVDDAVLDPEPAQAWP